MLEKKAEIKRLNIEIERADNKIKAGLEIQLENTIQEMFDIMNQIGKSLNVSNLIKQAEKEMKPFKITTSKKAGKTYLSADDERLLMDLQPYYNRDIDNKSDLWFDGITHEDFFKKLANRYGKSLSGIKKFSQRHDPNKK